MATCAKCGEPRQPSDFYKDDRTCKECRRALARAYRAENLEKVKAYDRERGLLPHRKEGVRKRAHRYMERHVACIKERRKTEPEKFRARNLVNNALRDGRLVRQPCERCGALTVHGHHDDYSKPLDVRWLCLIHHGERHRELNEQRRKAA